MFNELGVKFINHTTPIVGDNQGSLFIASNPVADKRTKHIDIHFHFIQEQVELKRVSVMHVLTKDRIADILTKNLEQIVSERNSV